MDKLFNLYLQELIEWNKKFNLTAVTDPAEIRVRHFEDSLSVLEAIDLSDQRVVDIGPGAGFPGLPLKIVRPGIKLTLVEATRKKIEFLRHLVEVLNLADVEIIWGRAEEVQKKIFQKFSRAKDANLTNITGTGLGLYVATRLIVAHKGKIWAESKGKGKGSAFYIELPLAK